MKTPTGQDITGFVWVYSPFIVIVLLIGILLWACSSPGERAAQVCMDAKLSPGTQSYENCVIRYLPTQQ